MNIVAIVQARMGSSRLPGKVLKSIGYKSSIEILLLRLSNSKKLNSICVATSVNPENDILCEELNNIGYDFFRGSEDDVLERYYYASIEMDADIVVRITGDCPVVDINVVDKLVDLYLDNNVDYVSNIYPPSYPDGIDVEVFSRKTLEIANHNATKKFDREHVTSFIREGNFTSINLTSDEDYSKFRLTLDEPGDLDLLRNIFGHFSPNIYFSYQEAVKYICNNPNIMKKNKNIKRNEGALMSKGQKLWKRSKQVIPGGNMLLSKRSEMHLPENWPSYFSKTSGCSVWDLDGNHFYDYYLMGVGTNILGYSHPDVDKAVIEVINNGNMSTLNAPEEVALAEKLIELDSWAGMVRFARTGGEANAVAIRIARAASGKDGVAICGYHGWHDWYLSANLGDSGDKLSNHLLPGLSTIGVPKSLEGSVHPFNYNDINHLESLIKSKSIGVIKMEVLRNFEPQDNFLKKVRKLASDNNIVLIFDECTSGFRECYGGLHKKYNVFPDIAVYGKTLGNGYAISAIVGKEDIMQSAQSTFISSTFWTERIGSAAALKTLEVMEKEKPWEHAKIIGKNIRNIWNILSKENNIEISINGLLALSSFTINSKNSLAYKTLITQEFLKRGYLAGTVLYSSLAHKVNEFEEYANILNGIFSMIADCENGMDIQNLLDGPICQSGFKRLN